jgi:2-amino-4-hydroxy-6-hydroxymethyldihydropteridine diphosphokinase
MERSPRRRAKPSNGVRAYVGLGSNLSHPRRQLARAVASLRRIPRTGVVALSPNYVTAPVGTDEAQPDYVNAVAVLDTGLAPRALLARLNAIERRQHRKRGRRNAARTLDLDLLLFGRRRLHVPRLTLPHPRMHARAFVLRPLIDVAPAITIPGHGLARHRLREVKDQRVARTRTGHR